MIEYYHKLDTSEVKRSIINEIRRDFFNLFGKLLSVTNSRFKLVDLGLRYHSIKQIEGPTLENESNIHMKKKWINYPMAFPS